MDSVILTNFYRCTIESILTGFITVWYGSCTDRDRKALRSVVRSAEFIMGRKLPALQDTYHIRCLKKAARILRDCYQIKYKCICIALFTRKHVTEGFTYVHRTAPRPT